MFIVECLLALSASLNVRAKGWARTNIFLNILCCGSNHWFQKEWPFGPAPMVNLQVANDGWRKKFGFVLFIGLHWSARIFETNIARRNKPYVQKLKKKSGSHFALTLYLWIRSSGTRHGFPSARAEMCVEETACVQHGGVTIPYHAYSQVSCQSVHSKLLQIFEKYKLYS